MPVKAERALNKVADEKGLEGEERDRFVYGILRRKFGWKPKRELDKSKKNMSSLSHLIKLNAKLGRTIEFVTPLAEFNKAHREIMERKKEEYRAAKAHKKAARRAIEDAELGLTPEHEKLQSKLHRESYYLRGAGYGSLAGATLGGVGGALHGGRMGKVGAALLGGTGLLTGGMIGAGLGGEVGGRIRRKHPLQEMSARLDKIIQFEEDDYSANKHKTVKGALGVAGVAGGLYGVGRYAGANSIKANYAAGRKIGQDFLASHGASASEAANEAVLKSAGVGRAIGGVGDTIAKGAKTTYGAGKGAIMSLLSKLRGLR